MGIFQEIQGIIAKVLKGIVIKGEASARCWEFKFTASSLSNNVNASALAEFHASLLWLNKIVGGSVPIFTEINIIYFFVLFLVWIKFTICIGLYGFVVFS